MKQIISNRVYIQYNTEGEADEIRGQFTHMFQRSSREGPVNYRLCTYIDIKKGLLTVPVGFLHTDNNIDYDVVDNRVLAPVTIPPLRNIRLRPDQVEILDQVKDNCLINALPGWGKTICALGIMHKLQQKTLVITHNTLLREQWITSIKDYLGITAGVIGSGKFNLDPPIVVCNIQSTNKDGMNLKLAKVFGLIIIDEAKRVPSRTMTELVDISHARYKIGLEGTIERKDGLHKLIYDFISPVILKPEFDVNIIDPNIKVIKTDVQLPLDEDWASRITKLYLDEEYQRVVLRQINLALDRGYSIMLLAERTQFLKNVHKTFEGISEIITGETPDIKYRKDCIARIANAESQLLCGSTSIFKEAISIKRLDCLIITGSTDNKSMLEQMVRRVMRLHPDKKKPLVIDFQLLGSVAKRHLNVRLAYYKYRGYNVSF